MSLTSYRAAPPRDQVRVTIGRFHFGASFFYFHQPAALRGALDYGGKRSATPLSFRACFKIPWESCFRGKGWMARRECFRTGTRGYSQRSPTEEQRSQPAFSAKTLRAAGLLSVARVGSDLTARCGDALNSPPWPQPKSLAAAPLVVSKQALSAPPVFPSAPRRAHWPSPVRVRHTGCSSPARSPKAWRSRRRPRPWPLRNRV